MNAPDSPVALRSAIRTAHQLDEATCVRALRAEAAALPLDRAAARSQAAVLVSDMRRARHHSPGLEALMQEFTLSSHEGVALMCLAEALLRIPDHATADALIRDKLQHRDWASHVHHPHPLFVHAAAWGLLLCGRLVSATEHASLADDLRKLLAHRGDALIRKAVEASVRLLSHQFVLGNSIGEALRHAREPARRGYTFSFDMLGEAALTRNDAARYRAAYQAAIDQVGTQSDGLGVHRAHGVSVKLSALHPRFERSQRGRVMDELLPTLRELALRACQWNIGFSIDAEEADRLELTLDLLAALAADPALGDWEGLGCVIQAYQKRAPQVVDFVADLARRSARPLMVRLVKGAYWDTEIRRAQQQGLPGYPVFTQKHHTDLSYLVCAGRLLAAGPDLHPQFATHNPLTVASVLQMARALGQHTPEFQCLHGMGESLYDFQVGHGPGRLPCRIYAPVGDHRSLLPYLVRRMLENGANSSFVHRLADDTCSIDTLLADPLDETLPQGPALPLPGEIYSPDRLNSSGADLCDERTLAELEHALAQQAGRLWDAAPLLANNADGGNRLEIRNPAKPSDLVGYVSEASEEAVESALHTAQAATPAWHAVPAVQRAELLRRCAVQLEANRDELLSLLCREAGKTIADGISEIREAVDFCRYYAAELGKLPATHHSGGPVVAISPWNFPVAIFTGQVAAALAAGRPVLAKPAEQTPLCAAMVVRLFHTAGIPRGALQLLPGAGEVVGAQMVKDSRVRGILFTGSLETAVRINREIARREDDTSDLCFVAETGGINAMLVDASALPEQVVHDVLISGFNSAGQRCSALRVLCLQQDIADPVITMLKDAMSELVLADPARLETDIGPVIDTASRDAIEAHVANMLRAGHAVFRAPQIDDLGEGGCFVLPTLIEVERYTDVAHEVFGPVVHVLRYTRDQLDPLLADILHSGYGLTLGIHSRIDSFAEYVQQRVKVGNIYVNRTMIGAVVGVQPFGGCGLSGTGPKAGGPLYLPYLMGLDIPLRQGETPRNAGELPEPFVALEEWAIAQGRQDLVNSCAHYRTNLPAMSPSYLRGSTGESNAYQLQPRGRYLCEAGDESSLLAQLAALLATGNTAVIEAGSPGSGVVPALPERVRTSLSVCSGAHAQSLSGVLFAGTSAGALALSHGLGSREGGVVGVVRGGGEGRYRLLGLMREVVLSRDETRGVGDAGKPPANPSSPDLLAR